MKTETDIQELAWASMRAGGKKFWLLVAGLTGIVLLGLVAWIFQLSDGLWEAGYNNQAFWAVYEANLVTFIGLSYGGAVVSAILRLTGAKWRAPLTRLAEGTALVTLLIGMAFAVIHLGNPERIWELVTRPNLSSPIIWDFVAVTTYLIATCIFFYLPLIPDLAGVARWKTGAKSGRIYHWLARRWEGRAEQRAILHRSLGLVAILIIPLAVSVHSVLSWAFALTTRPGWDSSIFPPYFVVAALYSGVALVILVVAGYRWALSLQSLITPKHLVNLGFIMTALGALYLYLTFADLLTTGYEDQGSTPALLAQLLTGTYAPSFWLFVFGGCIAPLVIMAMHRTRTTKGVVVASACVVAALWLKRLLIVVPVANEPLVAGGWGAFHFTWISVSITLAAAAAVPLLLMLLYRLVPAVSAFEVREIEAEAADVRGRAVAWPATETL